MPLPTASRTAQSGFSLVELLVALLIGLFLAGAVSAVFLLTNRSFADMQRLSQMGDGGRFAMELISYDLRHHGFMGAAGVGVMSPFPANQARPAVATDCTGNAAALAWENGLATAVADANGRAFGCINDAAPGTGVVVIKYVRPQPLATLPAAADRRPYYVLSNNLQAVAFEGRGPNIPSNIDGGDIPNGEYWEYIFHAYYIRQAPNRPPVLSRRVLGHTPANALTTTVEELIEGVEDLQVDVDPDVPSVARLFLLVRSLTPETGSTLGTTARTYVLGNRNRVIANNDNDRFQRVVLQSTVHMRNRSL